jgi:hypothetical protein
MQGAPFAARNQIGEGWEQRMGLESEATYEGRKLLTVFHPMISRWLALIGSSERRRAPQDPAERLRN